MSVFWKSNKKKKIVYLTGQPGKTSAIGGTICEQNKGISKQLFLMINENLMFLVSTVVVQNTSNLFLKAKSLTSTVKHSGGSVFV